MRVLFIARATLYTNRGGDTIQILATCEHLQQLNVEVQIKLCNEQIDYSLFDLIHFFNIARPSDILRHIKKSGKPYVISTIYVDYSEFERKARKGFFGFLRLLPKDLIEYAKVIGRAIVNGERIVSPQYLVLGQRASVKYIISHAALLLPNSNNEYTRLVAQYKIEQEYRVIPNGCDEKLFQHQNAEKEKDLVLCVGRIEALKNQLNLIKALNNSKYRLLIIGSPSTNHQRYYKECKESAAENVRFISNLPQSELVSYYQRAKVHVLPSWFETTGLSSLEAAAMGCNIVITEKGDAKEYFQEHAFYCEPDSVASIKIAVNNAASAPCDNELKQAVHEQYTWSIAAKETLEAYHLVLSK